MGRGEPRGKVSSRTGDHRGSGIVLVAKLEATMALVFGDIPTLYDSEQGIMRWFGVDNGRYVECRVTGSALTKRCGARGITDVELRRAFKENREKIEAVAKSKYAAGKVTSERDSREQTRIIIVLDIADL